MSVYAELLALGYTDAEIREAAKGRSSTRTISLALMDTPDETPIVGLTYVCDYRAEEEAGISKIAEAFNNASDQTYKFAITSDGMHVFSTRDLPNDSVHHQVKMSQEYHARMLPFVQESEARDLNYKTVSELKAYARAHSISLTGRTKKADILATLIATAKAENPNVWPAWFHFGDNLMFRADKGIIADTLKLLVEAVKANTFAISNSSQVFSSGLGLYDSRDIGPKLKAQWEEQQAAYEADMKKLEPVAAELKARGHKWFFLGNPTVLRPKDATTMETRYWLNGDTVRGLGQPFGWYTLEELLAEKFLDDLKAKHAAK